MNILEAHVLDKSVCEFKIASLLPHEVKNYKKLFKEINRSQQKFHPFISP